MNEWGSINNRNVVPGGDRDACDIIFNERRTILISDHNRMGDPNDYDR